MILVQLFSANMVEAITVYEHKKANSFFDLFVEQEFLINEKNKKVPVAGCRCIRGSLKKGKEFLYKMIRGGSTSGIIDEKYATLVVKRMPLASLRHLKNEVDNISKDMECGIRFDLNAAADRLSKDIQEQEAAERARTQNNPNLAVDKKDDTVASTPTSPSTVTPDQVRDLHFLTGDRIVCYQIQRMKQKTKWTPEGF